jgi:hypothetical protein
MKSYNKIDDGAKEAVIKVLKKKKGGNKETPIEKQIEKEVEKEEQDVDKIKLKEKLVAVLVDIDDEAETFDGSIDDYINDRLKILDRPQYDEEGDVEKIAGARHTIKHDMIEKYAEKNALSYEEAIEEIINDIELKKKEFKKKYGKKLPITFMLRTYEFNQLKTLSKEGAKDREQMSALILGNRPTNFYKNEIGYCNEYMFERYVLKNPDTEMNVLRFVSSDSFYDTTDFVDSGTFIELKTVIQVNERTNKPYENPIFWCPQDKVNKILEKTDSFKIYWSVIKPNGGFKESCERYNNMVYNSVEKHNPNDYLETLYYIDVNRKILKKVPFKNRQLETNGVDTYQSTYLFDEANLGEKGVKHYLTDKVWKKESTIEDEPDFID